MLASRRAKANNFRFYDNLIKKYGKFVHLNSIFSWLCSISLVEKRHESKTFLCPIECFRKTRVSDQIYQIFMNIKKKTEI